MRRTIIVLLILGVVLALPGVASADHPAPDFGTVPLPSANANQGGEGEFEIIDTLVTGNPHTDLDFFTQDGVTYASVGTLAVGGNNAGQTIVKLTDDSGAVTADTIEFVAGHPSATCVSRPDSALGLQHDVEATPKGLATNLADTEREDGDAQILIDATDARGRCHDQGDKVGFSGAPLGGLEIIDITDVANPVEIGLTSHIGEAHTVNVDPRRPHIAYAVTSDSVSINDKGDRTNEPAETPNPNTGAMEPNPQRFKLDGFEVVDVSSCMNFPNGASPQAKRDACRPDVYRYRWPTVEMALGHKNQGTVYGCHELEIFPGDKLTCGSGAAMIVFDMAGAFDDNGTPNDFTDDTPRGTPLPCEVRDSSSAAPFATGAKITDCVREGTADELSIPGWKKLGEPSLQGVKWLGSVHHQGRQGTGGDVTSPAFGANEDIDFDHEAEFTRSGDFILATDERGGGVTPPGATCAPGIDNPVGNGGIHAYDVDKLQKDMPSSAQEAWAPYAKTPDGEKAIMRAPVNTKVEGTTCTAHVFQQMPDENRIFMGWYSQGTQVVDYRENADGTFEFAHVAYFIPENANEWVSHVFKREPNDDGTTTYYGVAGDFNVANAGRNAIDVWKATLPSVKAVFDKKDRDGDGDGDDGDGNGDGDVGVGDTRGGPTLPATGGGMGLVPAGLALLGVAAVLGRSRRRDAGSRSERS